MYDVPELRLCAISKPRGKPKLSESLKSDSIVQSEIEMLLSELTFDKNNMLVLKISCAFDDMIWETIKYLTSFY